MFAAIKKLTLVIAIATLVGCAIFGKRSFSYGNIPLYKTKDLQNIVCYLQTNDSIYLVKKSDSISLVRPSEERCSATWWSVCEDWLPSCQGWVSNVYLDSLISPPPDYDAY
jgi:hypothetical protein